MQEEQKETAAGSPVASFQTRRDKPIEVMSLQEKFIELRRQIPRIEKGQHSEEVPYKFGSIAEGKTVKVKSSATKYATGQTIPSWVKSRKYTVQKIDGDRALLKEITSWVKISDLELA